MYFCNHSTDWQTNPDSSVLIVNNGNKKHFIFSQESAEYSYHYEEKVEVEVEVEQRGTTCCISSFFKSNFILSIPIKAADLGK